MKIMTYFNAREKAGKRIKDLERKLSSSTRASVWGCLMRAIRQSQKFTEKLIQLIEKADKQ